MPAQRVILFTGAPTASSVDSSSCTVNHFDKPFHELLGIRPGADHDLCSAPPHAVWRSLPLTRQVLHTGFTPAHDIHDASLHGSADFFATAGVSLAGGSRLGEGDDAAAVLTQFCEHSLAQHNSLPSSQLDDSLDSEETSLVTTESTHPGSMPPAPVPSHLSELEDVPSATRIAALQPQTVTLNLIVGVLSIAQPRTVTTRWGTALSLVEVLVGDDTAAGFAVTFWLSSDGGAESSVVGLRRQDVVLMENVALHIFRGKVYGQSLRRGLTRVSLLWRRDGSGCYSTRSLRKEPAEHPQQEKTRVVKDWVLRFVGRDPATATRGARESWDKPPDDTQ
ncbi:Uncharacterized protein TCAP_06723 [Tolypocladium capitatum]|uniref:Nucleic acid-binding, OB-fold protein n=1 Tax=Tolypocladium capitatum TaxID=45235 RepID=A0A2K3Q754_9HYPO|nr:Uncharacterized protein TCAP_06723 [Tolypocladium capitatum]